MRSLLDLLTARKSPLTLLAIDINGRKLDVELKRNARSRRMTLRMARNGESAVLSLPRRTPVAEAKAFLNRSAPWLAGQLEKQVPRIGFSEGAVIPLRGGQVRISAVGGTRGLVHCTNDVLTVPGKPEHVSRRVTDWLKKQAMSDIEQACARYAAAMNVKVRRITIRDQKSRWGSCSSSGDLSFSWRLILAPPLVLDYVAAHEVAHLLEMNHSPRFWRHVLKHCPRARDAKNWMRQHGGDLHRYG